MNNKKITKIILLAIMIIISFSSIVQATNWVQIIDETDKKGVRYQVWVNTDKLRIKKIDYDPFSYISSDIIRAYIKYEKSYKGEYLSDGICDFGFCLDGKWYYSQGGPAHYRNMFGTFSSPEPAFPFRELYYKRDIKIFKAVMDYWNNNHNNNQEQ